MSAQELKHWTPEGVKVAVKTKAQLKRLVADGMDVWLCAHWTAGGTPLTEGLLSEIPDGEYELVFPDLYERKTFGTLVKKQGKLTIK